MNIIQYAVIISILSLFLKFFLKVDIFLKAERNAIFLFIYLWIFFINTLCILNSYIILKLILKLYMYIYVYIERGGEGEGKRELIYRKSESRIITNIWYICITNDKHVCQYGCSHSKRAICANLPHVIPH